MREEKEPEIADNWPVYYPGHPEVTFADLKAGRFPKLTPEELAERHEAVRRIRELRQKLDIRPLTAEKIIRSLRDGIRL